MHLYIEQNTDITETVDSAVIKKLYELAVGGTLDVTSDLKGTLHTTIVAANHKSYLEGMFSDLHITADEYSLVFEDPEFERICVANWGSNGAVTANQLAAVTNCGWSTFTDNTSIIKANDLKYFTGISGSGNSPRFAGCTNLTEITIPPNLHVLNAAFADNCTSLTTIHGLDHVHELTNSPLNRCSALTSLVFTSLTGRCEIGEITNSALTELSINEGATSIYLIIRTSGGPTTFNVPASVQTITFGCPNVTTITFAQNSQLTTTPNYGGFGGCTNLKTINNFPWDTWTTMGSYCFSSCQSLQGTIKTPVGQTVIDNNTFHYMQAIDTIIVDSAVTTINNNNFGYIRTGAKIIMNPTSPPTLSQTVSGERYGAAATTGCVFYVPDASYNDYISNGGQYWTELYNNGRIKKMSELPS